MDIDDAPIGRVIPRREALIRIGGAAVAFLVACADKKAVTSTATPASSASPGATSAATTAAAAATAAAAVPACIVRPALTEGPYFVDEKLNRADIRSDPSNNTTKPGAPLNLTMNVSSLGNNACTALANAMVDVWHCDAAGVYSDAQDPGFNTKGTKFLRGYQVTNSAGKVQFTTIYPGWYQGRAVHVHFKIRTTKANGQIFDFTSQFFFDETITDQVHALAPYSAKGQRTLRNNGDDIYRQGGSQLLLAPTKTADGYTASFDLGLQLT